MDVRRDVDRCSSGRRLLVVGGLLAAGGTRAGEVDPHARHAMVARAARRTVVRYEAPDVRLVRDDGRVVSLVNELDDGRPVVLAFVYTSCTTVCPAITQTLAQLQTLLGPQRDRVHLMSISIDPEYDTPARLRAYAQRFGAGPEWHHYTGTLAASQATQRAFGVYRGDKMEHQPATLVRMGPGTPWVRIDGFASPQQLLAELPDYCTSRPAAG